MAQLPNTFKDLPAVLQFVKEFGLAIALSGLCGVKDEESGRVIAMECLIKGKSPREIGLEMTSRFNLMNGKLSLKAEAMLADFHLAGGTSKIVERGPDRVSLLLAKNGESETFTLTWADAQLETFPYAGKESDIIAKLAAGKKPTLKPKYATPRSRMQMLWARIVSDSVRAVAPEVTDGAYTPEEIADIIEADTGEAVEVAIDEEQAEQVPFDTPGEAEAAADSNLANSSQIEAIKNLLIKLEVPIENQRAALQKRGATDFTNLSFDGAADFLSKLQEKAAELEATRTEIRNDEPCTSDQVELIKEQINVVAQSGDAEISEKIKQKLVDSGLDVLADLSVIEADMALAALKGKEMQLFFDASLHGHKPAKN